MARPGAKDRGIFEKPVGSNIWWARWTDQHGKDHKAKCGSKKTAKQFYLCRKADALEGRRAIRLKGDPTIADLVDAYQEEMTTNNKRSAANYIRNGELFKAEFGSRVASQLTAGDVERWKAAREKQVAPATVNLSLRFLKRLYNLAIRDELLTTNPLAAGRVREVADSARRERILSTGEEMQLEQHTEREFWLQIVIALETGLRQAEQFGLKHEHVDWARAQVELVGYNQKLKLALGPKGVRKGGKQYVKLNSKAMAALREVVEAVPAGERNGYLWPNRDNPEKPIDGGTLAKKLQRLAVKLDWPKPEEVNWYFLRHTFVSRLVMMAVPLPTVQKLARHKSIQTTMGYAHLCPNHEEVSLENLVRYDDGSRPGALPEPVRKKTQPELKPETGADIFELMLQGKAFSL